MAALLADLLDLLADPETHEPLTLATDAQLAALRAALGSGKARRRDGKTPGVAFDGALLRGGRKVVYLIEGGIPNLLVDERLELDDAL
jgi:uncharacterized protein YbaR (Trm112 family)